MYLSVGHGFVRRLAKSVSIFSPLWDQKKNAGKNVCTCTEAHVSEPEVEISFHMKRCSGLGSFGPCILNIFRTTATYSRRTGTLLGDGHRRQYGVSSVRPLTKAAVRAVMFKT